MQDALTNSTVVLGKTPDPVVDNCGHNFLAWHLFISVCKPVTVLSIILYSTRLQCTRELICQADRLPFTCFYGYEQYGIISQSRMLKPDIAATSCSASQLMTYDYHI